MYDFDKENDKEFLREAGKLLQEKVLTLEKLVAQKQKEKEKDVKILQKLSEELKALRKRVFDSKQERKANSPKNKRKKGKLPHNKSKNENHEDEEITLDQKIIEYNLEDGLCPKCGSDKVSEMKNCFEESSEFEVIERRYLLKRHKRKKYSCKCCNKISTAPGGVKLTPGGEYSIQMATQIACDKFEDHLPLERQRKQMKRAGLNVEVKTLFGLTEHLYNRLYPLQEMIRQDILGEKWIHIDESPINFYNPNKSKGYIWSMSNPRGAFYQFEPTRSGSVAREMLRGYTSGNVVTDGYGGYNFLDQMKNIGHAFCWAHVRRKFFEAMNHDPKAEKMVDFIDELYEIEHEAEEVKDLKDLRSDKSLKVIKEIDNWIQNQDGHYLDSSSMGKAINYYLDRKDGLHLFLYDENVPIDNNMAERRQRCPVMGRKNFLHFKSINGADVGSFFYSVIESCKSNGLDARGYINEMAHRSAKGEELESPYQYSSRLSSEIMDKLVKELSALSPPSK
ncbi:MAG: IS66 family transposase [Epsilonproteobacteria bacterium]|nr:MAG: IS66 family transposase [Campylobacterota bacterium]RLA68027.1 MAG: IS66 family transposase [Campylobacterota bacterium]